MLLKQPTVAVMYDRIAPVYDKEFMGKADYQVPRLLREEFARREFNYGSMLDIGCGTGKILCDLGARFIMYGIEASGTMCHLAKRRGYVEVRYGFAEEVLSGFPTKSVDHVIALSSLYFVENIDQVLWESLRIARKSVFFSLEQFCEKTRIKMRDRGIRIFNHPSGKFGDSVVIRNTHLWTRPTEGTKILGDIVHKII